MDRERAESYLRQLAEAELRRARTLPAARIPGRRDTARLALVAQALVTVGAVDAGTADQIRAGLELAVAVRQPGQENQAGPGQRGLPPDARRRLARLMHTPPGRIGNVALPVSGLSTGLTRPAPHRASWRVVPAGQVIPIRDDDVRRELLLVAYLHSADGARFTMAGWPFRPLTAVDDHGASYQLGFRGGHAAVELVLRPDPPPQIRWLDLVTAAGEPATRIDLDPQIPTPDVTVTRNAHSPGELLLDVIAARILCSGAAFPQDDLEHPAAGAADLRAFIGDGPGDIVAALHAAGALPPASPVPGQLAGLCTRIGIPGHGITAPPADLPEPWHSMVTRPRRLPQARPEPGIAAATVAELPELDGARITILGLHHSTIVGRHNSATQTIVHMLVSGVTPEDDWTYGRVVRPLPALWVRDSSGRWHATRTNGTGLSGNSGEVILWLEIVPELDRGTPWIDMVATGRSAEVRVRLPLCWK
ncbi:MAG TPA: hypothetical protein VG123_27840 [Streptosporangiaceae bacterium]|nr:hypothetical protein [Streptosporangiaceae bacterium]